MKSRCDLLDHRGATARVSITALSHQKWLSRPGLYDPSVTDSSIIAPGGDPNSGVQLKQVYSRSDWAAVLEGVHEPADAATVISNCAILRQAICWSAGVQRGDDAIGHDIESSLPGSGCQPTGHFVICTSTASDLLQRRLASPNLEPMPSWYSGYGGSARL